MKISSLIIVIYTFACVFAFGHAGAYASESTETEFRSLVAEPEFEERSKSFEERIELAKQSAKAKRPALGLRITSITPDGQAAKRGLEENDIIVKIDDFIISSIDTSTNDFEDPRKLRVYQQKNDRFIEIEIEPGKIGVHWDGHYQPELVFLREGRRGDWDRDVLIGCLAREVDPELSETAWHRALEKGYQPDLLSQQLALALAIQHGRLSLALKLAKSVDFSDQKVRETFPCYLIYQAAIANSDFELVERFLITWPVASSMNPAITPYLKKRQEEFAQKAKSELVLPSKEIESMYADDLLPHSRVNLYFDAQEALPKMQKGESIFVKRDTGSYAVYRFGPPYPVPNFELCIRFKIKRTNLRGSRFAKAISILVRTEPGLDDFAKSPANVRNVMRLHLEETNEAEPKSIAHAYAFDDELQVRHDNRTLKFDGETIHELRLLRCKGMGEMLVDGRRICLSPVSDGLGTGFLIQVVGTTVEIVEVKCAEYVEQAESSPKENK